jgi:hypothetical protein
MEHVFPIEGVEPAMRSIKLRCFKHVKDNLKAKLIELAVTNKDIIKDILGQESGGIRTEGLVDKL